MTCQSHCQMSCRLTPCAVNSELTLGMKVLMQAVYDAISHQSQIQESVGGAHLEAPATAQVRLKVWLVQSCSAPGCYQTASCAECAAPRWRSGCQRPLQAPPRCCCWLERVPLLTPQSMCLCMREDSVLL